MSNKENRIVRVERTRSSVRRCICCNEESNEPVSRLYALEVGRILNTAIGNAHTVEITICDDCIQVLSEKLWNIDRSNAKEINVYRKTNMTDIPSCCGDCKITNCKLPIKKGELVEPYDTMQRHPWCQLVRI